MPTTASSACLAATEHVENGEDERSRKLYESANGFYWSSAAFADLPLPTTIISR